MWKLIKRIFLLLPALLAELVFMLLIVTVLEPWAILIELVLNIAGFCVVFFLVSYRQEGAYRTLWLLFFTFTPVAATVAYLFFGNKRTVKPILKKISTAIYQMPHDVPQNNELSKITQEEKRIGESLRYLNNLSSFPVMPCESSEYYPLGEDCLKGMIEEMEKAEKYIFLEYFIVEDGSMWKRMTDVLAEKVKNGVDVRMIYDDLGSISTFSGRDTNYLKKIGIKYIAFNPLKFVNGTLNNRSHRKMLIIDGHTVFSGGINIADEYINEKKRFGHWKDIGFKITGPAVWNYLYMFSVFWNAYSEDRIGEEQFSAIPKTPSVLDGSVLSYCDSPGNHDALSNNFYIEMLGNVTDRAWFYTPYLMLGDNLLDAFIRAAQRGVDVRVIIPGIPDKKMPYKMTKNYAESLMHAGVRVYAYTPGFIHAKACIFDDKVCTVGTVNLDYRSLYLHFENNSVFYDSSIMKELEKDYLNTVSVSTELVPKKKYRSFSYYVVNGIIRVFSPLC